MLPVYWLAAAAAAFVGDRLVCFFLFGVCLADAVVVVDWLDVAVVVVDWLDLAVVVVDWLDVAWLVCNWLPCTVWAAD